RVLDTTPPNSSVTPRIPTAIITAAVPSQSQVRLARRRSRIRPICWIASSSSPGRSPYAAGRVRASPDAATGSWSAGLGTAEGGGGAAGSRLGGLATGLAGGLVGAATGGLEGVKAGRLGRAPLVELAGAAPGVPVPATGLAGTSAVGGEGTIEG